MLFEISSAHFNTVNVGDDSYWVQKDRTDYRVEVDHDNKVILVIGRPSSQGVDWLDNFDFRVKSKPRQWFADNKKIRVHEGFLRQYESVRNDLLDLCYKHEDYQIWVTGYSLGGSWSQIFVQDCLHRWPDRFIRFISYACGNPWRRLPREYKKALRRVTTFVINFWDPVTWMRLILFFRYGKRVQIGRPWRFYPIQHHPTQMVKALDQRTKRLEKKVLKMYKGD